MHELRSIRAHALVAPLLAVGWSDAVLADPVEDPAGPDVSATPVASLDLGWPRHTVRVQEEVEKVGKLATLSYALLIAPAASGCGVDIAAESGLGRLLVQISEQKTHEIWDAWVGNWCVFDTTEIPEGTAREFEIDFPVLGSKPIPGRGRPSKPRSSCLAGARSGYTLTAFSARGVHQRLRYAC